PSSQSTAVNMRAETGLHSSVQRAPPQPPAPRPEEEWSQILDAVPATAPRPAAVPRERGRVLLAGWAGLGLLVGLAGVRGPGRAAPRPAAGAPPPPPPPPLRPPQQLRAVPAAAGGIELRWRGADPDAAFRVERAADPAFRDAFAVVGSAAAGATGLTDATAVR